MSIEVFLEQAVVILAASVAVVLLSARVRLAPVAGFLLTGMLIGPSGLALVEEVEQVELFAEIGVIFLLFAVGLEFSLERLRAIGRAFFLGGSLQTGITMVATLGAAIALGSALPRAIFVGFVVTLSSTAIVLKLYIDRQETETPQGKLVVGVLLFQDFLLVPMLVLTPVLAGTVAVSAAGIAARFALSLAGLAAVFLAARLAMPRLLRRVVATRVRELLVLGGVLAALALALVTSALGLSLALGAFLAGIIISESEFGSQIEAEVSPLRDIFTSVFFVSVGMLVNLAFARAHLPAILLLALAIVVVKAAACAAAIGILRFPWRIAAVVGLALAQVGEFSFVLLEAGRAAGLVDYPTHQVILAAAVLTMLVTPALVSRVPPLLLGLQGGTGTGRDGSDRVDVVIVGFGGAGQALATVLKGTGISYRVVELNGETVRRARERGEDVLFGDAVRRDILVHAGVPGAETLVYVVSDLDAVRRSISLARALNPSVHILVRTRNVGQVEQLERSGANEVIAEEFETSIEILTRVLRHHHVPRNVILAQTRLLRGESYMMLRSPAIGHPLSQALLDALAAGTTEVFQLSGESALEGRSIRDLDLRSRTGATIIAVVRGEQPTTNPAASFPLKGGDCLVLVGSHAEIDAAFRDLEALDSAQALDRSGDSL